MDPYALKRDNRKKFQDKEKLKRRHATPSDRKYHALNKSEEPVPVVPELQANDYRYHEDISMTYGQDDFNSPEANEKIKEALRRRVNIDDQSLKTPSRMTRKDLDSMSAAELNALLTRRLTPQTANSQTSHLEPHSTLKDESVAKLGASKPKVHGAKYNASGAPQPRQYSAVPAELTSDQDLLDDLI